MNAYALMQDFQTDFQVDEIRDVSDAEILAAFNADRKDIAVDPNAREISGGDLSQLDIEFD